VLFSKNLVVQIHSSFGFSLSSRRVLNRLRIQSTIYQLEPSSSKSATSSSISKYNLQWFQLVDCRLNPTVYNLLVETIHFKVGLGILLWTLTVLLQRVAARCNDSKLQCITASCSVLQWVASRCRELLCVTASWASVLKWVAVCCSVLKWVAVCCSVYAAPYFWGELTIIVTLYGFHSVENVLQWVAMCCSLYAAPYFRILFLLCAASLGYGLGTSVWGGYD